MSDTQKDRLGELVSANEPWLSEELPFNFTATGFLGAKRQEMLTNPLLLRNRVGRGRSSSDAIFGSNYRCPWTMANVLVLSAALNGWAGVLDEPQQVTRRSQKDNTDYLSLNRGAVSAAMISSSDNRTFREQKGRVQQLGSVGGAKRQERPLPKIFKPGTVFGMPHKYESIEALTSNAYQRQWLLDSIEGMWKKNMKIDFTKVRPNRASLLRPNVVPSNLQSQPWRNPKLILKARPHLSTFRGEKALLDAQKIQELESPGKDGQTGQGIPKNTPHEHPLPSEKKKCSSQFPCI
ncbi:unnamed protein product [Candidula unifasciata]|uniref:Uncharacterized protein n=1 Tax=Candidula unifasciata TaxID=100452 RepID=A0A8S3YKZ8_9EUPU|nr:unnamed protein product [Candidula unifasciata]